LIFCSLLVSAKRFTDDDLQYNEATVIYNQESGQYTLVSGINTNGVAYGSFNDTLSLSGWGVLKIQTNPQYGDNMQMYAAGYLEGALTSERIYQNYQNIYNTFFGTTPPSDKLYQFLKDQDNWVRSMIKDHKDKPHWKTVGYIMSQFDGLMDGYAATTSPNQTLPLFAFQTLNGCGDFLDLLSVVDEDRRVPWDDLAPEDFFRKFAQQGHCSALVKVPGDYSDLWAGHSSWFTYGAMNRIYKQYNFDLTADFIVARKLSFSSYPGFLESLDDFYIMDSGLVMLETSNGIFNQSLYDLVQPKSLFAWQRVRLANHMAHDGMEWGKYIRDYNSGTYNNQYMVVDYNKFTPGQLLQEGTLVVVEQIPGLVEFGDVTVQLERGYWPSYNVPYFETIYNISGYPEMVAKYGTGASYQLCPRAQIFRRDQGSVVDLDSFKAILRYNNYKNDPYSKGDPGNAICSRFDLEPTQPDAGGCYDTKVTSFELQSSLIGHAISGPTTSHGLPPFQWTPTFDSTEHLGQPNLYNFDFVVMDPEW